MEMEVNVDFAQLEKRLRARDDLECGGEASRECVREAEAELGVEFPLSLCRYFSRFGHLRFGGYELYGLGEGVPARLQLVEMARVEREEALCPVPRRLVPMMNDGSGCLYCVDTEGSGVVVLWDYEGGTEQEVEEYFPSFEAFLVCLLDEVEKGELEEGLELAQEGPGRRE